jgi:hypothetical protein
MTFEIPLTQGQVAIVDDVDADLANVKWCAQKNHKSNVFYASRGIKTPRGQRLEQMHRVILERMIGRPLCKGEIVDHVDENGTRNVRSNLRLANHKQNMRNRGAYSVNSSGFKGIGWDKQNKKWRARIRANGKLIHLGLFDDPAKAHAAYCEAARKYHGQFANFGTVQS